MQPDGMRGWCAVRAASPQVRALQKAAGPAARLLRPTVHRPDRLQSVQGPCHWAFESASLSHHQPVGANLVSALTPRARTMGKHEVWPYMEGEHKVRPYASTVCLFSRA